MDKISLREKLILDLFSVNGIKFGKFKLKSGIISPYYIDLRMLVSYPYLLKLTAEVFWEKMRTLYFDIIVGVPYTAIPIATAISLDKNQHMIFIRKEKKSYGTGKFIEGVYYKGQHVVIIDDVISDGASKFETIKSIEEVGLAVSQIIVLLDRGQGGPEIVKKKGYHCTAITDMKEVLEVLYEHKKITYGQLSESQKFMMKTSSNVKLKNAKNLSNQK